jgi:hypothetical protein
MVTITLTNASAAALFDWCEEERSSMFDLANTTDECPEIRAIYEARYKAIREVMDKLGILVRRNRG